MNDFIPLIQDALWIGLIVFILITILPNRKSLRRVILTRIKRSPVEIGAIKIGELKDEVDSVKSKILKINQRVANLFLTTMSPYMYTNLKKLHSGQFFDYTKTEGLVRELYHLRDIGYIEVLSIKSIPKEGENLSDYVRITPTGAQFVELREEVEKEWMLLK